MTPLLPGVLVDEGSLEHRRKRTVYRDTARSGCPGVDKVGLSGSRMVSMSGAFIMVFLLVVGFPVTVMASGAVLAVLLGQSLWQDGEDRYRGSELVELNR